MNQTTVGAAEAARLLGVNRATVYRLAEADRIQASNDGGRLEFALADVERLRRERETEAEQVATTELARAELRRVLTRRYLEASQRLCGAAEDYLASWSDTDHAMEVDPLGAGHAEAFYRTEVAFSNLARGVDSVRGVVGAMHSVQEYVSEPEAQVTADGVQLLAAEARDQMQALRERMERLGAQLED